MTVLLEVGSVCAWYGEAQVLHGVDLRIEAGELVLLCGRNGSGRSTFAKALVGLVRRAGSIVFAGEEIVGLPTFEIARRGIGYVAEQREVFPTLSVEENLRLGIKPGQRATGRAMKRRIDETFDWFPLLAQRRATSAGVLSGGEQQMLVLARALLGEPRLVVVDEPTEGLAPQAVAAVEACLQSLCEQGGAVLLIEQRLTMAQRLADRIAVMGHGRIVFDGAVEALDATTIDEWIAIGSGR
ncbi:ABC transporter ATP-binding protein [Trinickia soli]|jgi:branched-chain amino acid transport system ATP-binding protein|uniref:ABC transporter ATP-binding protein n=1 Tax=Trinickia soli TaxID=380675 RepID=A0A2N7VXG7_9BURK|nr:ABC transporter ATP-binding protein [Trinickia soli]KAA0090429.1 ABC transporter ATP-binding protein [Paraburkholderia sp. T12-10]PMS21846.1 ABC transporter ATP-binding protein [Trinickia soli]CAB3649484.1 High-affinity branched-chain amino acid transport ATP-binding protein LivF [Trinickia soli]